MATAGTARAACSADHPVPTGRALPSPARGETLTALRAESDAHHGNTATRGHGSRPSTPKLSVSPGANSSHREAADGLVVAVLCVVQGQETMDPHGGADDGSALPGALTGTPPAWVWRRWCWRHSFSAVPNRRCWASRSGSRFAGIGLSTWAGRRSGVVSNQSRHLDRSPTPAPASHGEHVEDVLGCTALRSSTLAIDTPREPKESGGVPEQVLTFPGGYFAKPPWSRTVVAERPQLRTSARTQ